ncbi:MAG TPA: DUF885 family protein, partial [Thermoanaerobaculia bacterium]
MRFALLLLVLLVTSAPALRAAPASGSEYLDRFFAFYPTRATAAGRHDLDRSLEDLSPERRREWVSFNRRAAEGFRKVLADPAAPFDDRLDAELQLRQAELEILDHETLRTPERDPLYWTGLLGDATIFLLVRDDLPLDDRLQRAAARADLIPRLARQARETLAAAAPSNVSAELCTLAVRQARASAELYRASFPKAA